MHLGLLESVKSVAGVLVVHNSFLDGGSAERAKYRVPVGGSEMERTAFSAEPNVDSLKGEGHGLG
jgi:hypothetical protein